MHFCIFICSKPFGANQIYETAYFSAEDILIQYFLTHPFLQSESMPVGLLKVQFILFILEHNRLKRW